jgi:hypothetical protein
VIYRSRAASGPTHLQVALAFADAPTAYEYFDIGDATSADWTTADFDLSAYEGRTVAAVGLRVVNGASSEAYSMRVGRIGILVYQPDPNVPLNLRVLEMHETSPTTATVRLAWDPVDRVNSYALLHGDTWLGGTANTSYFIGNLVRDGDEARSTITVESVGLEFTRSDNFIEVTWDHVFADGFDG